MMYTPVTSRKHPASSPLAIFAEMSTPRRYSYTIRFKVSVLEWQCKNEPSIHRTCQLFSINRKHVGGRNHERKHPIPCISPPPALCTKAIYGCKRGAYLLDSMVLCVHTVPFPSYIDPCAFMHSFLLLHSTTEF